LTFGHVFTLLPPGTPLAALAQFFFAGLVGQSLVAFASKSVGEFTLIRVFGVGATGVRLRIADLPFATSVFVFIFLAGLGVLWAVVVGYLLHFAGILQLFLVIQVFLKCLVCHLLLHFL
jgi:hypothetical protein